MHKVHDAMKLGTFTPTNNALLCVNCWLRFLPRRGKMQFALHSQNATTGMHGQRRVASSKHDVVKHGQPTARVPARRHSPVVRVSNGTITLLQESPRAAPVEYIIQPEEFYERKPSAQVAKAPEQVHVPRTRTVLMAGNWKMNPATAKEARELAALVASAARTAAQDVPDFNVELAVIPPYPFLALVAEQLAGTPAKLGAQDVYPAAKGAFTGAVSPGMLASMGTQYVLAGHSERRVIFGETDTEINKKVHATLASGMCSILCIGESRAEYEAGLAKQVCSTQLRAGLQGVSAEAMLNVVIAYEPVWAIGTGLSATPAIAQAVHFYIRSALEEMYGTAVASQVRIQYGGSVTPETVDDLMACPDIDGCLIGGASLAAEKFARIFSFKPQPGPRKLFAHEAVPCGCTLGESVVWSSSLQRLFWVDSVGCSLWSWDLVGKPLRWQCPEVLGCVALQEGGDLLLGLQSGIFSFSPETGVARKLADFETQLDTRPNDGRVDRSGNFVIGSYNNAHRQNGAEIGGLWRLTPDGNMQEILDYKFRCSNCVCFSPDGSTMYFTDTPTRRIFAFDYSPTGKLSNRRLLYEMPSTLAGGPDGAQTDSAGYLWVCLSGASQVVRIAPDGSISMVVEMPVSSPTCCTIGGPSMDTLYISTRKPDGGSLYAVKLPEGITGNVEPEFQNRTATQTNAGSRRVTSSSPAGGLYCSQCGAVHQSATARFCSECGTPRH